MRFTCRSVKLYPHDPEKKKKGEEESVMASTFPASTFDKVLNLLHKSLNSVYIRICIHQFP